MKNALVRFFRDEDGQGMTEYGLIIALVAIIVAGTLLTLGEGISDIFTDITSELTPDEGE